MKVLFLVCILVLGCQTCPQGTTKCSNNVAQICDGDEWVPVMDCDKVVDFDLKPQPMVCALDEESQTHTCMLPTEIPVQDKDVVVSDSDTQDIQDAQDTQDVVTVEPQDTLTQDTITQD